MLKRGTGGAGEARAAVAQYDETSPLYGLLLYRRRKVLVKYVPEGTSRLLQGTRPSSPNPSWLPACLPACNPMLTTPSHSPCRRPLHQH